MPFGYTMRLIQELSIYKDAPTTTPDDQDVERGLDQLPDDTPDDSDLDDMLNVDVVGDDSNVEGLRRYVPGARLVSKRANDEGSYDELWIYNTNNIGTAVAVRKAILAGTDIGIDPDTEQTYDIWTVGNVEMLYIKGMPN